MNANQSVSSDQCQKVERELNNIKSMNFARNLSYQMKTETNEKMTRIKDSLSKTLGTMSALMQEHLDSLSESDRKNDALKTTIIREEGFVKGYRDLMEALDTYNNLVNSNMDKIFSYMILFNSGNSGGSSGGSSSSGSGGGMGS